LSELTWVRGEALLSDLNGTLVDTVAMDGSDALARPGVATVLTELVRLGSRWAVCTSIDEAGARMALERAALPVPDVLVTADDVIRNKPAPDGYRLTARRLGVDIARCLVAEDTRGGVAAALDAGALKVLDVGAARRGRVAAVDRRVQAFSWADVVDIRGGPDDVALLTAAAG
jgi:beta-phosphoglucomutase-like phosphatase (HAD superfamily)